MQVIKPLIVALSLTAGAGIAAAQPHGPARGVPFDMDRLAVLLDLDEYQKQEVERVLSERRENALSMRREWRSAEERPSFEAMQALREQRRQETLTQLGTVLTESQMTKFQVLTERPERPARNRGRSRGE
jgi:hypothetical protein